MKKFFVKYLKFISKNILEHEDRYHLNFQLEGFNPYMTNDQPVRQKLAEIVHAMGVTIRSTRRPPIGRTVEATAEDIFYTHLRGLPDSVEMEIQGIDPDMLQALLHQVMVQVIENAPYRSLEVDYLKPYLVQEDMKIGIEDVQRTFNNHYGQV